MSVAMLSNKHYASIYNGLKALNYPINFHRKEGNLMELVMTWRHMNAMSSGGKYEDFDLSPVDFKDFDVLNVEALVKALEWTEYNIKIDWPDVTVGQGEALYWLFKIKYLILKSQIQNR